MILWGIFFVTLMSLFAGSDSGRIPLYTPNTCPHTCPDFKMTVCGTNNKTYQTPCHLQQAACKDPNLKIFNYAACRIPYVESPCTIPCIDLQVYACGTDGRTYYNGCYLENEGCVTPGLKKVKNFPCPICKGECPKEYKPVCASDGKIFNNYCELLKSACYIEYLGVRWDDWKEIGRDC